MYGTVTMNSVCHIQRPIRGKIPEKVVLEVVLEVVKVVLEVVK